MNESTTEQDSQMYGIASALKQMLQPFVGGGHTADKRIGAVVDIAAMLYLAGKEPDAVVRVPVVTPDGELFWSDDPRSRYQGRWHERQAPQLLAVALLLQSVFQRTASGEEAYTVASQIRHHL